jgi:hypothetical protein
MYHANYTAHVQPSSPVSWFPMGDMTPVVSIPSTGTGSFYYNLDGTGGGWYVTSKCVSSTCTPASAGGYASNADYPASSSWVGGIFPAGAPVTAVNDPFQIADALNIARRRRRHPHRRRQFRLRMVRMVQPERHRGPDSPGLPA